jgi:hypothetical protein
LADIVRTVRFHYNESDSFQPAPAAYNLFGELLPDPTGSGKDFGFSFSALDGKLYVRFNKYETLQNAARNGSTAVIGTRPIRLDFDASGDASGFGSAGGDNFDLEDTAYTWVTTIHPTWTLAQVTTEVYRIMGVTQDYVNGLKNRALSDVNDVQSKGTEIEIFYNPTRFWTVKGTITQQKAVDTSISPNIARYIAARMPTWTSVRIPTDRLPDGTQLAGAGAAVVGNWPAWRHRNQHSAQFLHGECGRALQAGGHELRQTSSANARVAGESDDQLPFRRHRGRSSLAQEPIHGWHGSLGR